MCARGWCVIVEVAEFIPGIILTETLTLENKRVYRHILMLHTHVCAARAVQVEEHLTEPDVPEL